MPANMSKPREYILKADTLASPETPKVIGDVSPPYSLEEDPTRSWGVLMATPGFYYRGEYVPMSSQDLQNAVRHHAKLSEDCKYEPPILLQHDPEALGGETFGWVEELTVVSVDEEDVLLAKLRWNDLSTKSKIRENKFRYLSPSVGGYEDDLGYSVSKVILEVSVTPSPYQKRLGSKHLLSENSKQLEEQNMEEILAQIKELKALNADLLARLEALEAANMAVEVEVESEDAEEDPKPEEAPEEDPKPMSEMLSILANVLSLSDSQKALVNKIAQTNILLAAETAQTLASTQSPTPKQNKPATRLSQPAPAPAPKALAKTDPKADLYAACLAEAKNDFKLADQLYASRVK